jgi:3-hydroxyacyl-[acyl-carrier-protein] dehydratase
MAATSLDQAVTRCLQGYTRDPGEAPVVRGEFVFPPDFPPFAGHFPDQAVLPAVVQLAAVRLLAGKALGQDLVPVAAHRVKFRGMIRPNESVIVAVELHPHESFWRAAFTVSRESDTVASGRIDLARA